MGTLVNVDRLTGGPGACCHPDGSCDVQTQAACTDGGGAYQGQGTTCEDVDCTHTGACCYDTTCRIQRADDCTGTYQGDGTVCDPNPCGGDTGACCIGGECSILTSDECNTEDGYYFGNGSDCDPSPCVNVGCCLHVVEGDNFCDTITGDECFDLGGTFVDVGTFCFPSGNTTGLVPSCCSIGDIQCTNLGVYTCCNPDTEFCCTGESVGATCCPNGYTCCGDFFPSCCPPGQICDPDFGGCVDL